ncbi:MAG: EscU/YscU/HrcU family type III secretion system export apparatus switch protein, partial [Bdellovibrionales bacterium]|nr:EscU/YscU/HrcU family type III secretion system export apparatus switch protein [Bdellovibrionales bacterium]
MAEAETGEKTEEPTAKRLAEARNEGQVAKSTDLSQIFGLTAAFLGLQLLGPRLWEDLLVVVEGAFSGKHFDRDWSIEAMHHEFLGLLATLLPHLLLLFVIAAIFGAGCTAVQTKF